MTDYSSKDAIDELLTIGVNLLSKAEKDVKKKKVMKMENEKRCKVCGSKNCEKAREVLE